MNEVTTLIDCASARASVFVKFELRRFWLINMFVLSVLLSLLVVVLGMIGVNCAENGPRLLVSKEIINKHIVEKMDMLVKYNIYNIGDRAAINIRLTENGFPSDRFDLVIGDYSAQFSNSLEPDRNFTHVMVFKPQFAGRFNCSVTEIVYDSRDGHVYRIHSSSPNIINILPFGEYSRKYSSHVFDWITFTIISLPSLVVPFTLWFNSKQHYDSMKNKSLKN